MVNEQDLGVLEVAGSGMYEVAGGGMCDYFFSWSFLFASPFSLRLVPDLFSLEGLQGVGLQPEILADRLLVKLSQPASKIETYSDKHFVNLYESWFRKALTSKSVKL